MRDKPTKDIEPAPGWRFLQFLGFGDGFCPSSGALSSPFFTAGATLSMSKLFPARASFVTSTNLGSFRG